MIGLPWVQSSKSLRPRRHRVLLHVGVAVQVDVGELVRDVTERGAGLGGEGGVHEAEVAVGASRNLLPELGPAGQARVGGIDDQRVGGLDAGPRHEGDQRQQGQHWGLGEHPFDSTSW
jgi:hypothetical protein